VKLKIQVEYIHICEMCIALQHGQLGMHSWQIVVSQFTMAPRRDSSTVTRPTSGVISRAGDPGKIEEDKNEIRDYVKEVLFEKVVFVWNKGAL
jgi:hypothetical protein